MHFEILVEGQADLTALSILMPNIVGKYDHPHTWSPSQTDEQPVRCHPFDRVQPNRSNTRVQPFAYALHAAAGRLLYQYQVGPRAHRR